MARIAIDIDGVLATTLVRGQYPQDYPKKQAIPYALEALKILREKGHILDLFTARYEEDRAITEKWLVEKGFSGLYDKLIMGKPRYDVLFDDRAIRFEGDWLNTLYKFSELEQKGVYHNDGN